MSKIPFLFTPIPRYFENNGWMNDSKNCMFIFWCLRRCANEKKDVFWDGKNITLQPYQFIFGRKICVEETDLSENEIRSRIAALESEGIIKKIIEKCGSRYTIYEFQIQLFCEKKSQPDHQHNHQHNHQHVDQKTTSINTTIESDNFNPYSGSKTTFCKNKNQPIEKKPPAQNEKNHQQNHQQNHHKQEQRTKNHDFVLKETNKEKAEEVLFLSNLEKKEFVDAVEAYLAHKGIEIVRKTIYAWLKKFPPNQIKNNIEIFPFDNGKILNPVGWMRTAIEQDYAKKESFEIENRGFLEKLKDEGFLRNIKMKKKYCINSDNREEYYFNLPPETFQRIIKSLINR